MKGMYAPHLKRLIEETLRPYNLASPAAVNLLLGTAAQESGMGHYLWQLGAGPALGIFQMEPSTYEWLRRKFANLYGWYEPGQGGPDRMVWDLQYAALLARLRYRVDPHPLPDADDITGLAHYWKRVYNTKYGKGKPEEFVENYRRFVLVPGVFD